MHNFRAWLLTPGILLLGGCAFDSVDGSGHIITEPRTVAGFSAVSLNGSGRLVIEQTGSESLTVTTDDNLLPHIKSDVRNGTLELGSTISTPNLRPTEEIIFKLTVKTLSGLEVSGSGKAEARGVSAERLDIRISGSGDIAAQGTASDLQLGISGSGGFRGEELKTQRTTARISGSGRAVIAVNQTLDATVSGSGSIEYTGAPQVSEHISGSGSVRGR